LKRNMAAIGKKSRIRFLFRCLRYLTSLARRILDDKEITIPRKHAQSAAHISVSERGQRKMLLALPHFP
jgi:hypothetical protein